MYEIDYICFKGENVHILNKGNIIASTLGEGVKNHIFIYEKPLNQSNYKLNQEVIFDTWEKKWPVIGLALLSNEMIIASGRRFIVILKKDKNNKYQKHQEFFEDNWAEMINIKELKNIPDHFAACGFRALIIFSKQNDKYQITFEINYDILGTTRLSDFIEIKGKEKAFIVCSMKNILITRNKTILNKIEFHKDDEKSSSSNDYICEFNDELFLVSGQRYITLVNTNKNTFKQIKFLSGKKDNILDSTKIYKYDINTIILLSSKKIIIIQIFDDEKIQINMTICIDDVYYGFLKFIKEEKSVYFQNKYSISKLTFNNKMKYS